MKIINIKFRKTKKVYPFMINDTEDYKREITCLWTQFVVNRLE